MKRDLELEELLKKYTPPAINAGIRQSQIKRLSDDIRNMDYFPPQSYIDQILTQLSFISSWVWFTQAGILFLFFCYAYRANLLQIHLLMFGLAPGLSLILVCEISKSFRADIWEMEAACRYNLAQIFFFRICILFGGDFLVLTGALIAYRMADGLLWQFCFYALLPFLLTSAISLYALRRIGNRCNPAVMTAVPLLTGILVIQAILYMNERLSHAAVLIAKSVPVITILAFLLLLYNALRLCTGVHYLNESSLAAQK